MSSAVDNSLRASLRARQNRQSDRVAYLLFSLVAIREILNYVPFGSDGLIPCVALLALVLLLIVTRPFLMRRASWYRLLYFPLFTAALLLLASLKPYFDMWAVLFIALGMQAIRYFTPRVAIAWNVLFAAIVTGGLTLTQGFPYGLTVGLSIVAGGVFFISYDLIYGQAELARQESQALLTELQEAHRQTRAYADQIEELATTQERNRLARELHDSVNQVIFGVTLTAQAARLLLDRDPARVPEQLDRLQDMTRGALAQLRSLITQLRPPSPPS